VTSTQTLKDAAKKRLEDYVISLLDNTLLLIKIMEQLTQPIHTLLFCATAQELEILSNLQYRPALKTLPDIKRALVSTDLVPFIYRKILKHSLLSIIVVDTLFDVTMPFT
jgi:hypothetical protein